MFSGGFRRRAPLYALAATLLVTACAANSTNTGSGTGPGNGGSTPGSTAVVSTNGASTATATGTPVSDIPIVEAPAQAGVQHLKFKYGPIKIEPGQNNITVSNLQVPKPQVDGYITGIYPDLVRNDGSVPPVDVIHLHHGVWLKVDTSKFGGRRTRTTLPDGSPAPTTTAAPVPDPVEGVGRGGSQFGEIFFASGEEKTKVLLPAGYGYPYQAKDVWVINYMLHNLLATPDEVYIVYDLDFIPKDDPAAAEVKTARPIWNDVENGKIYPVFDVLKGSGRDGLFTYPDDAEDPYQGKKTNEWEVDKDSVLLTTAGHLHPGGLYTDMYLTRAGAGASASAAAKPSIEGDKAHIFRSDAIYYEPAGAVSWDVSMTATDFDWMVGVKAGDVISISSTYDTKRASWYESMGIMVLWVTDAENAPTARDPFQERVDETGVLTHGHLAENDNHGGGPANGKFVDMTKLPNGPTDGLVTIADFAYGPGDMSGIYSEVPTVKPGETLRFFNADAPIKPNGIWHTVTACQAPCDGATGVAYPLADAEVQFDSGELGAVGPPTAGRVDWTIPTDLAEGTYTYFCRVHPIMRGAFRVDADAPGTGTTAIPGK